MTKSEKEVEVANTKITQIEDALIKNVSGGAGSSTGEISRLTKVECTGK